MNSSPRIGETGDSNARLTGDKSHAVPDRGFLPVADDRDDRGGAGRGQSKNVINKFESLARTDAFVSRTSRRERRIEMSQREPFFYRSSSAGLFFLAIAFQWAFKRNTAQRFVSRRTR